MVLQYGIYFQLPTFKVINKLIQKPMFYNTKNIINYSFFPIFKNYIYMYRSYQKINLFSVFLSNNRTVKNNMIISTGAQIAFGNKFN